MSPFFLQGLQHPFLTPAHLIILIALGIFLGQQGKKGISVTLPIFVMFALAGLIATRFFRPDLNLEVILLAIAALIGILIALKLLLPRWIIFVFASLTAVIIALDSAPVMIPGLKTSKIYTDMAGTLTSISLILLCVSLIATLINKFRQGIALRIIGSWVFASALMVLAFMFAPAKI